MSSYPKCKAAAYVAQVFIDRAATRYQALDRVRQRRTQRMILHRH